MYKIYSAVKNPFTSLFEVWKPVVGWEGLYSVSSFGQVKSEDKIRDKISGPALYKGRLMKQKTTTEGYKTISFRSEGKNSYPPVHRLVALAFIKNTENKATVNHIDGDKANNCVGNLEWATHQEQTVHAFETKLIKPRGHHIYSPDFKREVLNHYNETGCSVKSLCTTFGISSHTATRIARGEVERKGLKLSEQDVEDAKILRQQGFTLKAISEKIGCGISQIHRITRGLSRDIKYERDV